MLRIDLAVPLADHSDARLLGARWDAEQQVWFVPEDRDASVFAQWLLPPDGINIRAPSFFIASSRALCRRCRGLSRVHGFALPQGNETLYVDDESGEETWEMSDEPTFMCYLDYVAPTAIAAMRARTAHYRIAYRHRTRTYYWANHCEHCGTKLGDYDVFCEPGDGFMPLTRAEAARIVLEPIDALFVGFAGAWSLGCDLFESMVRAGEVDARPRHISKSAP